MIHTAEEFIQLRSSANPADYRRAAHEPALDGVWEMLVEQHQDMRRWVAQNKTVPLQILERLAADSSPAVRAMVAMKRKLPETLQQQLAQDPDAGVRFQIACNPNATRTVLLLLSHDSEPFIRTQALQRLG